MITRSATNQTRYVSYEPRLFIYQALLKIYI